MTQPSNLLTVPEACERARVSRRTLYSLMSHREIEAVKIGKRTFIWSAEVDCFLGSLPSYQPTQVAA